MIRTLIIDDEPLARDELCSQLAPYQDIEIIGQCANAIEGMAAIHQQKPDLVFLDISMPRISGMDMLAMLDPDTLPCIVFVTAYDDYAVQAFENNAFDYLLKPIEQQRLAKCIERIRKQHQPKDLSPLAPEKLTLLPCFVGNALKVIKVDQVEYAFSDVAGVHITSAQGACHTHLTLKVLESKTPLLRCHRQYLIHPTAIREIRLHDIGGGADIVTCSGKQLPVSRRFLKQLKLELGY